MHFLYVFILQSLYKSTCFERPFRSKHVDLYKDCRINTHRKCILLVCLYNWLRCTVHTYNVKYGSNISAAYDMDRIMFVNVRHTQNFRSIWPVGYFANIVTF